MTKSAQPPEIERIKIKDLTIDNKYSGRTEKEITENAKEKAKELEAAGGWSPTMPGQYFIGDDGNKHLLAGFSRVKATLMNGEDFGYFVQAQGDEIDHLLACETTNSTRPLSTLSRGARYSDLREGVIADDFTGQFADPKKPGDWKRVPMTNKEIAARVGKTDQWVGRCITIFEAPPEIRDMIESDKIAVSVADEARKFVEKHHEGNEVKQVAMCRKAFAQARQDGKDTATKQHFDAIKEEFMPVKKLVADGKEDESKSKKTSKKEQNGTQEPSDDENNGDDKETLPAGNGEPEHKEPELFPQATEVLTGGTKKHEKLVKALATAFTDEKWLKKYDLDMILATEEAERLAEAVMEIVANAAEVF